MRDGAFGVRYFRYGDHATPDPREMMNRIETSSCVYVHRSFKGESRHRCYYLREQIYGPPFKIATM